MDQSQSLIRCLDHTVSAKTQRMRGWWMGSLTVSFKEGEKEYSTQHHIFNQGLWPPSQHPLMSWFKTKCPGWSNLWSLKSEISLRGASTFSLSFCFMLIQSSTWLSPQSKLSTKKKKKKKNCPQSWLSSVSNKLSQSNQKCCVHNRDTLSRQMRVPRISVEYNLKNVL